MPLTPQQQMKLAIIGAFLLAFWGWGAYQHHEGYAECQTAWDNEEKIEQDAKTAADKLDKEAHDHELKQHAEDLQAVKSQAGHDAIAGYLRAHGVLPDSPAVCSSGGDSQTLGDKGNEIPAGESGTSQGGAGLAAFSQRCAADALSLLQWQEWADINELPVK